MLDFLQDDKTCKGIAILRYFGELPDKACNHCSVCRKPQMKATTVDVKQQVLSILGPATDSVSLSQLSSQFRQEEQTLLIDTLRRLVETGKLIWHPDNSFTLPITKKHR
jgi:ATP-dependent DNA helicase RecQ